MDSNEEESRKALFELLLKRLQDASAGATRSLGIALTLGAFCVIYLLSETGAESIWRWGSVVRRISVAQDMAHKSLEKSRSYANRDDLSKVNRPLVQSPSFLVKAGINVDQVDRVTQFIERYDPTPTQLSALAVKLETDALSQRSLKVPLLGFDVPNGGIYSIAGVIIVAALGLLWRGLAAYNRVLQQIITFKKCYSLSDLERKQVLVSDTFATQPSAGPPYAPISTWLIMLPLVVAMSPSNVDPAGFSIGLVGAKEMLPLPFLWCVSGSIVVLTFGIVDRPMQHITKGWIDICAEG